MQSHIDRVAKEYYRLVVLGDPHLPVRLREVKDPAEQQAILVAKCNVIDDINQWDDVNQVHVVGDITAQFGLNEEYAFAKDFFAQCRKPLYVINGNHDYIYDDCSLAEDRFIFGDALSRQRKLQHFQQVFKMPGLYYSQLLGPYALISLAIDSLESPYLAQISPEQLEWLQKELQRYKHRPTIILFHSPLDGTLDPYDVHVNTPDFVAKPEEKISELLRQNRQVFLWVAGHTHTPIDTECYASPINYFADQVTVIHNIDMDRVTIWSNSLYLYDDRVVVKTFNHSKKTWETELERTIFWNEQLAKAR